MTRLGRTLARKATVAGGYGYGRGYGPGYGPGYGQGYGHGQHYAPPHAYRHHGYAQPQYYHDPYEDERRRKKKQRNNVAKAIAIGAGIAILGAVIANSGRRR